MVVMDERKFTCVQHHIYSPEKQDMVTGKGGVPGNLKKKLFKIRLNIQHRHRFIPECSFKAGFSNRGFVVALQWVRDGNGNVTKYTVAFYCNFISKK